MCHSLYELKQPSRPPLVDSTAAFTTLEEAEREHIRQVLHAANWQVGGPNGAAARLGMKRTTLQSKMAKLGIERPKAGAGA
jgi:formate hydrogenlyase transcriptional activator